MWLIMNPVPSHPSLGTLSGIKRPHTGRLLHFEGVSVSFATSQTYAEASAFSMANFPSCPWGCVNLRCWESRIIGPSDAEVCCVLLNSRSQGVFMHEWSLRCTQVWPRDWSKKTQWKWSITWIKVWERALSKACSIRHVWPWICLVEQLHSREIVMHYRPHHILCCFTPCGLTLKQISAVYASAFLKVFF